MSRWDEFDDRDDSLDPVACGQRDAILDDEDRERWEWIEWLADCEPEA